MNFSFYIAKRYLLSKSNTNAINIITYIALAGIILGAASLFIVLCGFSGLKAFTLEFANIIDPDLKAETVQGKSFFLTEEQENALKDIPDIASYSKIIEETVIASFDNRKHPVRLKGVDAHYGDVTTIDSVIVQGDWLTQGTQQIVVGWGISNTLSFGVLDYGKRVTLYVPKPGKGQITDINQAFSSINAVNVGIFDINDNLNNTYVYTPISVAKEFLNYTDNQFSNIEFKLKSGANESVIKKEIQSILGETVVVKNRIQLNDALYKMLNTEHLAVYLIFTLVLIIAIFNVIGSLIMMILDKKKNLNTLYKLGAKLSDIKNIFFLQGTLMSLIGGVIGVIIGIVLVSNQLYGPDILKVYITPTLPYPVQLKFINAIIVFATISILGVIASKLASSRITKSLVESA